MKKSLFVVIPIFALLAILPTQCQETTSDGGLYKSEDMGESWEHSTVRDRDLSITSLSILSIVIDPNNTDILYLGSRGNGIYKSFSQAKYWHALQDENGVLSLRANIYDIAVDPKNSDRIYVGTYQDKKGRVFRSQDGGESWEEVYIVSEEGYAVFALAIDSHDPSVVYIGTAQGGFLRSTDYGKSWETMRWFEDVISDIVVNPQDTRIVYISTFEKGIYKSTDKGKNWQSFEEELKDFTQSERVENLVIDSKRPNILYAGSEYGLLTTKNGGMTWEEVNIVMPPESRPVLSLAIENDNTDHLYYGAGPVLYRSIDQGKNWTVHGLTSARDIKAIAIDPNNPQIVYAGMHKD
ncbi:MAG: YCF48-related protein [Candidatus Portnoybacteria bacterium]